MRISDWSSDVCSSDLVYLRRCRPRQVDADGPVLRRSAGGEETPGAFPCLHAGGACRHLPLSPAARRRSGKEEGRRRSDPAGGEEDRGFGLAAVLRRPDRKSVVSGKSVEVREDLGVRRISKKQKKK